MQPNKVTDTARPAPRRAASIALGVASDVPPAIAKRPIAKVRSPVPPKVVAPPKRPLQNALRGRVPPPMALPKAPARKPSTGTPARPASSPPTIRAATKAPISPALIPLVQRKLASPRTPPVPRVKSSTEKRSNITGRPLSCPAKVTRDPSAGLDRAAAQAKVLALTQRLKESLLVEGKRSNQLSTILEQSVPRKALPVIPKRRLTPSAQGKTKLDPPAQKGPSSASASRLKPVSAKAPLAIRPETPQNIALPPRPTVPTPRTAEFGPERDRKRIPKVERPAPIKLLAPVTKDLGRRQVGPGVSQSDQ